MSALIKLSAWNKIREILGHDWEMDIKPLDNGGKTITLHHKWYSDKKYEITIGAKSCGVTSIKRIEG